MKKIYYLGPKGSYSYLVTKKIYLKEDLIPCESFFSIVNKTLEEGALGTLPIENSITSDVFENVDYLFSKKLIIVKEAYLKINLFLIGLQNSSLKVVKEVYSHPKALAQSSKFIEKQHLTVFESKSTAEGKEIVIETGNLRKVFIGSRDLAVDPRVKILAENIGNAKDNMTRFIIVKRLSKKNAKMKLGNKMTAIFKLVHKPGSLANLLTKLAQLQINLTKIESRPIPETQWEYQFLVDFEVDQKKIKEITQIFKENTLTVKIIGVYQKGGVYES